MHEMALAKDVLATVVRAAQSERAVRVVGIGMRVGVLRDFDIDYFQRFFDHLSNGTIAEGARIHVEYVPLRVRCASCGAITQVDPLSMRDYRCPGCGDTGAGVVSGQEFSIEDIQIL